jgi:hypothetical protein
MKKLILSAFIASAIMSCSSDDDSPQLNPGQPSLPQVVAPSTYSFERNNATSVSYGGQTTRIEMADQVFSALKNTSKTEAQLDNMYDHQEDAIDFGDPALDGTDKSVRDKTAASKDYFSSNTTDATAIKSDFDALIANQVSEVFPNWGTDAISGTAGKIQESGGGSTRYVNAKGLEYNQAFAKGTIGALMTDQMLNNYLSTAVLDAGTNIEDNDADNLYVDEDGNEKNYTTMEHKWDEAYGYLFGAAPDGENPLTNIGSADGLGGDDNFLSKYLDRVNDDSDFAGIADDIYNAFKLGRAAIVAKNYTVRDAQAEIIREKVSQIIGVRAVYYLQTGKASLGTDNASAFHDLSEGYGFVYSLQFTRKPGTSEPYFTKSEVDGFISTLMSGNGFWDITASDLDTMSDTISAEFSFTTAQAGS